MLKMNRRKGTCWSPLEGGFKPRRRDKPKSMSGKNKSVDCLSGGSVRPEKPQDHADGVYKKLSAASAPHHWLAEGIHTWLPRGVEA